MLKITSISLQAPAKKIKKKRINIIFKMYFKDQDASIWTMVSAATLYEIDNLVSSWYK